MEKSEFTNKDKWRVSLLTGLWWFLGSWLAANFLLLITLALSRTWMRFVLTLSTPINVELLTQALMLMIPSLIVGICAATGKRILFSKQPKMIFVIVTGVSLIITGLLFVGLSQVSLHLLTTVSSMLRTRGSNPNPAISLLGLICAMGFFSVLFWWLLGPVLEGAVLYFHHRRKYGFEELTAEEQKKSIPGPIVYTMTVDVYYGSTILLLGASLFVAGFFGFLLSGLLLVDLGTNFMVTGRLLLSGIILGLLGIVHLLLVWALKARKKWARGWQIATSAISVFSFPIGTIVHGIVLYLLFKNNQAREFFAT